MYASVWIEHCKLINENENERWARERERQRVKRRMRHEISANTHQWLLMRYRRIVANHVTVSAFDERFRFWIIAVWYGIGIVVIGGVILIIRSFVKFRLVRSIRRRQRSNRMCSRLSSQWWQISVWHIRSSILRILERCRRSTYLQERKKHTTTSNQNSTWREIALWANRYVYDSMCEKCPTYNIGTGSCCATATQFEIRTSALWYVEIYVFTWQLSVTVGAFHSMACRSECKYNDNKEKEEEEDYWLTIESSNRAIRLWIQCELPAMFIILTSALELKATRNAWIGAIARFSSNNCFANGNGRTAASIVVIPQIRAHMRRLYGKLKLCAFD